MQGDLVHPLPHVEDLQLEDEGGLLASPTLQETLSTIIPVSCGQGPTLAQSLFVSVALLASWQEILANDWRQIMSLWSILSLVQR